MQCFKNVLVGVDLSRCRRLDVTELTPDALEVIDHGIWLAQPNGSELLFFTALNIPEEALHHLEEDRRTHVRRTVEELANKVLAELVRRAEGQGVAATSRLVLGRGWQEIIRQVLRGGHDLVVIGTRNRTGLRRLLFGSTSLKLLRRCPCPVLVVKAGHGSRPLRTLIATDLKPAAESAMRLGLCLGKLLGGPVHILHVVEYPLDTLWGSLEADAHTVAYHRRVRETAARTLQEQLERAGHQAGDPGVQLHLSEGVGGVPDVAIQEFIAAHHIDLLVMGTIARTGLMWITFGNTAERLLPEVDCSLLAVKPPDFQSSVTSDDKVTR
jgi:universal stress protein E